MSASARQEDLERISQALRVAVEALRPFTPGGTKAEVKSGGSVITEADRAVDAALRSALPRPGEGWLSEETPDDTLRLSCERLWVVDPLDGTREFVLGLPEWCVSIGLVEHGRATAGGICNPMTGETIIGAVGTGVWLDEAAVPTPERRELSGASILASRSEVGRGEWRGLRDAPFRITPVGSVAWKLALVAAGRADATWTRNPKHEWDVAAGTALVLAAGGLVVTPDGRAPVFNRRVTRLPGLVACGAGLAPDLGRVLEFARGPDSAGA